MTFWDHLDELRGILFKSAIIVLIFMVGIYFAKDIVFGKIVFAPITDDFALYRWINWALTKFNLPLLDSFSLKLINIELSAQFFIHITTSFYFALVIATPFILYQLWTFIGPALYQNEKKAVKIAFAFSGVLFVLGILVGYYIVFPLALRFLGTYQISDDVPNQISLQSYINMFTRLILVLGLLFELPTLAAALNKMGILSKSFLKSYRKHAVVALLILAAFITPSDPFSMIAVGLPLYLLYEFSILVCRDFDK